VFGSQKFDVGHLSSITFAGSKSRNAEVASLAGRVARRHGGEKTIDRLWRHEIGGSLATGMHGSPLAKSNHLLNQRTGRLALGDGGLDAVHQNDRCYEVAQHGAAVAGVAA
jgi:hypothetical protein